MQLQIEWVFITLLVNSYDIIIKYFVTPEYKLSSHPDYTNAT